jgi:hypothetical protein
MYVGNNIQQLNYILSGHIHFSVLNLEEGDMTW